jgi:hypothetical protein
MNVMFAMGVPTTADDRGYLLWLAQNWAVVVVPAICLSAVLIAWLVRKIGSWTAATPGSGDRRGSQMQSLEPPPEPNRPPKGAEPETLVEWSLEPRRYLAA